MKSDASDNKSKVKNENENESKKENSLQPNIQMFYEQNNDKSIYDKRNVYFQCILCKPKMKFISTSFSSNSNLRTHINTY